MKDFKLKNAIDFLMYSYFNLTLDDGKAPNSILEKSIEKAYSDATQQGAYNTLVKSDDKTKSEQAKNEGIKLIKESIKDLFNSEKDFDKWHKATCTNLVNYYINIKYSDKNNSKILAFSYGNAQKWLNMTMKYLYVLFQVYNAYNEDCKFCTDYKEYIDKYSEYFHIPVDSYIIEALWHEGQEENEKGQLKDNYNFKISLPIQTKTNRKNKYSSEKVTPWSKWTEGQYSDFKNSLSKLNLENKTPLDWEGPAWIEIAKNRKKKENKSKD